VGSLLTLNGFYFVDSLMLCYDGLAVVVSYLAQLMIDMDCYCCHVFGRTRSHWRACAFAWLGLLITIMWMRR